jgi:excisionase family DNA binding protein
MNPTQITYNYMSAADLDALIKAAEERGEKRGYEKAKQEDEAPMKPKEAAELLGITPSTLRNYVSSGEIKAHKLGTRNRFYRRELQLWKEKKGRQ